MREWILRRHPVIKGIIFVLSPVIVCIVIVLAIPAVLFGMCWYVLTNDDQDAWD